MNDQPGWPNGNRDNPIGELVRVFWGLAGMSQ